MNEIFEKLRIGAGKLKKSAKKVTKQVVRKTNDAVSQTKLSFAVNETENKISEIYEEMGRKVYAKYLEEGEACECMAESCSQVDKLLSEVEDLKEKIAELKHSVKCKACGEFNKNGSAYCSKCGEELRYEAEEEVVYEDAVDVEDAEETVKKVVTIRAKKPANTED